MGYCEYRSVLEEKLGLDTVIALCGVVYSSETRLWLVNCGGVILFREVDYVEIEVRELFG